MAIAGDGMDSVSRARAPDGVSAAILTMSLCSCAYVTGCSTAAWVGFEGDGEAHAVSKSAASAIDPASFRRRATILERGVFISNGYTIIMGCRRPQGPRGSECARPPNRVRATQGSRTLPEYGSASPQSQPPIGDFRPDGARTSRLSPHHRGSQGS